MSELTRLQGLLLNAQTVIRQQNEMLQKLTSPPLVVATVIRTENVVEKIAPEVENPVSFLSLSGKTIDITGEKKKGGIKVGASIEPAVRGLRPELLNAKSLKVVGFSKDSRVLTQIDGGRVVLDPIEVWKQNYRLKHTPSVKDQADSSADLPDESVTVSFDGKLFQVSKPGIEVVAGDQILIQPQTMQIVKVVDPIDSGETAVIRSVLNKQKAEIDLYGNVRMVYAGKNAGVLEKGDRVQLDSSHSIVMVNLGKNDQRFVFNGNSGVSWDDIGGLFEAKKLMKEAIEMPLAHPDLYVKYRKKGIKGILLFGPPRCGKTMLAKAAATALARIHGNKGRDTGYIYVKGPEILDKYVGVSEATVRDLFERARKHKKDYGYPAILFIDEAEAVLGKRGTGISSDIERTIVPMFLSEMDGLEDSGALVILATNRPDILDPAIIGDGRIDQKIKVGRPDKDAVVEIFRLHLQGVPLNEGCSAEDMAVFGREQFFAEKYNLYDIYVKNGAAAEKVMSFGLKDIVSGAMIAGVIDKATSLAIYRDLQKGNNNALDGITRDDITNAIRTVFEQNQDLNHGDDLVNFFSGFRKDIVKVLRAGSSADYSSVLNN